MSNIDPYAIAYQDNGLTPDQIALHAQMLMGAKKLAIERENSRGEVKLEFVSVDPSNCVFEGGRLKAVRFLGVDYDPSHLVPDQATRVAGLRMAAELVGASAKYRLAKLLAKLPENNTEAKATVTMIRPERKALPGQDSALTRAPAKEVGNA